MKIGFVLATKDSSVVQRLSNGFRHLFLPHISTISYLNVELGRLENIFLKGSSDKIFTLNKLLRWEDTFFISIFVDFDGGFSWGWLNEDQGIGERVALLISDVDFKMRQLMGLEDNLEVIEAFFGLLLNFEFITRLVSL